MNYNKILDLTTELGYRLAMSGAETFRVEESISRVLAAYGIRAEVFVIPNNMTVSIETDAGKPITIMRRISDHGNDLDAVEKYSNLSRRLCAEHPDLETVELWLQQTRDSCSHYPTAVLLLGSFLGALGFALLFGGTWVDSFCAGICGLVVGLFTRFMDRLHANPFFRSVAASFVMALLAYMMNIVGIGQNPDAIVIGTLMLLVPGLIFTNAMRDIIYGDTNSGVNRIVQVLIIAVSLAIGTASAWNIIVALFREPTNQGIFTYGVGMQCFACLIGCVGFGILFNIHGPGGLLCALGGVLAWIAYLLAERLGCGEILCYFWASVFASAYSEAMARIRKYPAISYLVVSIFPMIPGAGVYYTMLAAVQGNMDSFMAQGMRTAAIAGSMAVGILLVSTSVRLWTTWRNKLKK